jgi:NADH dehydrogenase
MGGAQKKVKILITGGTGFLGREIVQALLHAGEQVTLVCRSSPDTLMPREAAAFEQDLLAMEASQGIVAGHDAVIHAAVDYRSAEKSVEMTRRIIASCQAQGVTRLVYISSQNAGFTNPASYSRGKMEAERLVRASGLEWVIVRPTLLYCDSGGPFVTGLIRLARSCRVIPVLGAGDAVIQPVHVEDVSALVVRILRHPSATVITIGGRDAISLHELAQRISDLLPGRIIVPIPVAFVALAGLLHGGLREKLQELGENKTVGEEDLARAGEILGVSPRGILADLPAMVFG